MVSMPRVQKGVGSIPGRVNPKTLKSVFAASPLSTQHLGVRAKTGQPIVSKKCVNTLG